MEYNKEALKTDAIEIADFFSNHFLFKSLDDISFVKLISHVERRTANKGDYIVREGENADHVFFIKSGTVSLSSNDVTKEEDQFFGIEGILDQDLYNWSVQAQGDLEFYVFKKSSLISLLSTNYEVFSALTSFYQTSFMQKKMICDTPEESLSNLIHQEPLTTDKSPTRTDSPIVEISSWLFSIIIPSIIYFALSGMPAKAQLLVSIISSGFVLWIFNLLPLFVPSILILLVSLGLNLVPAQVILSGFSSYAFVIVLGLSPIPIILFGSGVLTRLSIWFISTLPKKQTWLSLGMYFIGFIITPIIMSVSKRTAFMGNIVTHIMGALKIKPDSEMSNRLVISAYFGTTSFSSQFLVGSMMNIIGFSVLPVQTSYEITSIGWFTSSIVMFFVMLVTNVLAIPLFFQVKDRSIIDSSLLKAQLKCLGPIKVSEWYAIVASIFFAIVIFTMSIHQVSLLIIGLFILASFLILNPSKTARWDHEIDWSFLMFIGTSLGIFAALDVLNVNQIIGQELTPIINKITTEPVMFMAIIIFSTIAVRLFLPAGPAFLLMIYLSSPIAPAYDISLWVVSFVVLTACDIWFSPYQSESYQIFRNCIIKENSYNYKNFLFYSFLINTLKIVSIFISISYWRYLGFM